MLLNDRNQLWPDLEKLGEVKVRQMLAQNAFEAHQEEDAEVWLARKAALSAARDSSMTKIVAIVGAVAAVIAAVASVWTALFG
ncbi:MAG: hypothetical protein ACREV2_03070 [Burkholderiales bacterium]